MKELIKIIKKIDGTVLGIGLKEELINELNENPNIIECNLLNSYVKGNKKFSLFNKKINIKKIKKKFKRKKIDYIICNFNEISNFLNTFVNDSVYINKRKVYYFGDIDIELLKIRYSRYNSLVKVKNKNLIEIDNYNAKTNFLKSIYYRTVDFKDKVIELIGDILMN